MLKVERHNNNTKVTLEVDVVGDPDRPKEAVLSVEGDGISSAPRNFACRSCRVTAGFGVHTWVVLEFQVRDS